MKKFICLVYLVLSTAFLSAQPLDSADVQAIGEIGMGIAVAISDNQNIVNGVPNTLLGVAVVFVLGFVGKLIGNRRRKKAKKLADGYEFDNNNTGKSGRSHGTS